MSVDCNRSERYGEWKDEAKRRLHITNVHMYISCVVIVCHLETFHLWFPTRSGFFFSKLGFFHRLYSEKIFIFFSCYWWSKNSEFYSKSVLIDLFFCVFFIEAWLASLIHLPRNNFFSQLFQYYFHTSIIFNSY